VVQTTDFRQRPMLGGWMALGSGASLLSLGRWLVEKGRDRSRRNARHALLPIAIEHQGAPLLPAALASDPVTAKVLDTSLVALGGDVVTDEAGEIHYAFPRIKEKLEAVARARARPLAPRKSPARRCSRRRICRSRAGRVAGHENPREVGHGHATVVKFAQRRDPD
jgi:hypothetical protein